MTFLLYVSIILIIFGGIGVTWSVKSSKDKLVSESRKENILGAYCVLMIIVGILLGIADGAWILIEILWENVK